MALGLSPREMLARLVAFPTVSTRSNLDLVGFVEAWLAGHGIASTRVPDATGEKAALLALIGPRSRAASSSPATATSSRWRARPGPATPGR